MPCKEEWRLVRNAAASEATAPGTPCGDIRGQDGSGRYCASPVGLNR